MGRMRRPNPNNEEWQEVPARRKGNKNHNEDNIKRQDLTKFYVANLPERCSGDDIKRFLGMHGEIDAVYVARKRNKMGQRFAFVSFAKVCDKFDLELRLRNTKIGDNKLFISIAKFVDGDFMGCDNKQPKQNVNNKEVQKYHENKHQGVNTTVENSGNEHGIGTSFRDTLTKNVPVKDADWITLAPNINAFSQWHGKAVVGRVLDFQKLVSLRKWMCEKGCNDVTIKYLGGISVLLVFDDVEAAELFVIKDGFWKEWFSKVVV